MLGVRETEGNPKKMRMPASSEVAFVVCLCGKRVGELGGVNCRACGVGVSNGKIRVLRGVNAGFLGVIVTAMSPVARVGL